MTAATGTDARRARPGRAAVGYRRLLAILPPGYRREHGDELLDVYLEASPDRGPSALDRLDVARLAARTWTRALFLPRPQDAERWWAGTVIGVLGLLSFGAARVVGDAVLAGWGATRPGASDGVGGVGGWWDTTVFTFATGQEGWHSDWLVWFLWAAALVLAVGLRRPTWAVVPAAVATVVAMSAWLAAVGSLVGGDRRYLVLGAWAPLVDAGWLVLQIVGFLVLVACARRGAFLGRRDLRTLRWAAIGSAAAGVATGRGMVVPWLLMSHDHWEVVVQGVLVAYLLCLVVVLVGTRTGRALLPYAAPVALAFLFPRALLLRVPVDGISWEHPLVLPGPYPHFLADLGRLLALPRHWEATTLAAVVSLAALAWFFGMRALRSRRAVPAVT